MPSPFTPFGGSPLVTVSVVTDLLDIYHTPFLIRHLLMWSNHEEIIHTFAPIRNAVKPT